MFQTIHRLGFGEFYRLRESGGGPWGAPLTDPGREKVIGFAERCDRSLLRRRGEGRAEIELQLEGIHCIGCLWLLERLPEILSGVLSVRLDIATGVLRVVFVEEICAPERIIGMIHSLGYGAAPLRATDEKTAHEAHERRLLWRVGVAGFCAANTMMLAVSLFQGFSTGIDAFSGALFRWVSLGLSLPAVTYCALPLYRSALAGIRVRRLHIDLPIVVAILVAFCVSVVNTVLDRPFVYFDSLTALIFLLLSGRYLQLRATRRARIEGRVAWNVFPSTIERVPRPGTELGGEGVELRVPPADLQIGEWFRLAAGERAPVDGALVSGDAVLDRAFLTGESVPIVAALGDVVSCGDLNMHGEIVLEVLRPHGETELGRMIAAMAGGESVRPEIVQFTDRVGKNFTGIVLALGCATWIGWSLAGEWARGAEYALTLLIVSCPCAVAITTPLMFSLAIARASQRGMLIAGADVLERLSRVRHIYLDKTGTVTEGTISVEQVIVDDRWQLAERSELLRKIVRTMADLGAGHPAGRALAAWSGPGATISFDAYTVLPGRGIEASIAGPLFDEYDGREPSAGRRTVRLGSPRWIVQSAHTNAADPKIVRALASDEEHSAAVLEIDGQVAALWLLSDRIRADAARACEDLRGGGRKVLLLSGDRLGVVRRTATILGIRPDEAHADCSPEEKERRILSDSERSAMVGDGINDSLGLRAAYVGIALRGAVRTGSSLGSSGANVLIPDGDLGGVVDLMLGADRTMRGIRRALWFSLGYNGLASAAAILGLMNPLLAAIVMPVSSLTAIGAALLCDPFRERGGQQRKGSR